MAELDSMYDSVLTNGRIINLSSGSRGTGEEMKSLYIEKMTCETMTSRQFWISDTKVDRNWLREI